VDDSLTTKDAGILATINFVIELELEEFDVAITRIDDPYNEGQSKIKPY
jgi:hypothetical protein